MFIKNYEIEDFGIFLYNLSLKGKESRMRTRFVKLLDSQLQIINEERQQLINDFAKKDEEGKILTEDVDGKQAYLLDNPEQYNLELYNLMNEEFIVEETEDKLDMLRTVKDVVLNCDLDFSGQEAMKYDKWCEVLEDIE